MYILSQEVQADQTLPIGMIGNPESMDHPKDQPLCLVLDSQGYLILTLFSYVMYKNKCMPIIPTLGFIGVLF